MNKPVSIIKSIVPNLLLIISIGLVMIILPCEPPVPNGKKLTEPISLMKSVELGIKPCGEPEVKTEVLNPLTENAKPDVTKPGGLLSGLGKIPFGPKIGGNLEPKKDEPPLTPNEKKFNELLQKAIEVNGKCPDFKHLGFTNLFLYLMKSSMLVSSNMTTTIINALSNFISKPLSFMAPVSGFLPGVFLFYIIIMLLLVSFSKFINIFMPIDIRIKKKAAFIYDILFSMFGVFSALYVVCLIPTIVIYLFYLLNFIKQDTDKRLIGLCLFMFFSAFLIFLPLILDSVQEGLKNKKKGNDKKKSSKKKGNDKKKSSKKKSSAPARTSSSSTTSSSTTSSSTTSSSTKKDDEKPKNNSWGYISLFTIIIPIASCIMSIWKNCWSGPHYVSPEKRNSIFLGGLVVLIIIIFLEIYAPHINNLYELL